MRLVLDLLGTYAGVHRLEFIQGDEGGGQECALAGLFLVGREIERGHI